MSETTSTKGSDFESGLAKSDTRVADFSGHGRTPLQHLQHFLHGNPTMVPIIVLLFGIMVFGLLIGQRFFNAFTMTLILQQVAIVGIVGVAQTLIILTAGIDLSVGAIMVLSSVIMGNLAWHGRARPDRDPRRLRRRHALRRDQRVLVAKVKLPPFIVTLGMWFVYEAINFIYTQNATIRAQDVTAEAPLLQFLGNTFQIGGASSPTRWSASSSSSRCSTTS